MIMVAPGDTRRVLRRIADGDLGRLPRGCRPWAGASAATLNGLLLLLTPIGGWRHTLGEIMIVSGIVGIVIAGIGAMRRETLAYFDTSCLLPYST